MVLGLGAKLGIAAAIPVAMAGLGVGGFFLADGTLQAELIDKACGGGHDPGEEASWIHDADGQSRLTIKVELFGIEQEIPSIQNNICYMLEVGDQGKYHVSSQQLIIESQDGFCKYDSTSDRDISRDSQGRYSNC